MCAADFRLAEALGNSLGDKRLDILRRIGESGSISSAARAAGVSYKAAWQAIETLSNLAGTALVSKAVGGSGGGGALLTPAGSRLLVAAERLNKARLVVLAELGEEPTGTDGTGKLDRSGKVDGTGKVDEAGPGDRRGGPGFDSGRGPDPGAPSRGNSVAPAALALRTSMRNHLPCVVAGLRRTGTLVEVSLTLADGTTLQSRITQASAELLDLRPGLAVLALCKATAVAITARSTAPGPALAEVAPVAARPGRATRMTKTASAALPARTGGNRLAGTVARSARAGSGGAVEISLALASGLHLVGFANAGQGLRRGRPAEATIEASAVVIALGH